MYQSRTIIYRNVHKCVTFFYLKCNACEPEVVVLLDELVHARLVLGLGVAHALVQRGLAALELLALQQHMHSSIHVQYCTRMWKEPLDDRSLVRVQRTVRVNVVYS